MKLYKISQDVNNDYDTYDSAIVCADNEDIARKIHPSGDACDDYSEFQHNHFDCSWCNPEHVKVEYIGEAKEGTELGVILASYNAG